MDNIGEALQLLVVGMLTVFMILLIVIFLGKGLIALVNKFAPEEQVPQKKVTAMGSVVTPVDAQTKSIIDAAVSQLTGGKGVVSKIQKI
jgi:oxaloacetate decarboxylase gamma subunit